MNYLLLVCTDGVPTQEKAAALEEHIPGWVAEMDGRGVRLYGHPLAGPETAVTVRSRDEQTLVTDGPFIESKEYVGGFDIINCGDLDEAIEIAAKHPVSWFHPIEVRPCWEGPIWPGSEPAAVPERIRAAPPADRRRYLLTMYVDGIPGTAEEEDAIRRDAQSWVAVMSGRGIQVFGNALKHAHTATTVRVRNGETLLSDGPFVETTEFIGGIDIVDCANREEAIEVAARHPLARFHKVEVRPFAGDETGDE
jgi:hypothetical protein